MGRSPCCAKIGLNRGAWTALEDTTLTDFIQIHGEGKWKQLPKNAGLMRCGKSCRLRWLNYLRPDIKRGNISEDEAELIVRLHKLLGNRWSMIAGRIPGRTDNEIKNYWNTNLSKKAASSSEMTRTPKSQMTKSKSVNAINKMAVRTLGLKSPPLASSSGVFRTRASRPPAFGRSSSDSNIVRNGSMENIGLSCNNDQPAEGKMQDMSNMMDVDDDLGLGLGDFCLSDFINTDHHDLDFLGSVNWDLDVTQYQIGCTDTGQDHNSELFSGFIDSYDNWNI